MSGSEDEVIWLRPEKPTRGKTPAYNRADIAAAGVRIADAVGLDGLSMRKVAAELGAGTMSLYRYVRSKDELLALMVDSILGDPESWPGDYRDWAGVLRLCAHGSRSAVLEHPWFPVASVYANPPGPNMLRAMEHMMAALDRPGLRIDELFQIVTTVMTFAQGYAQNELAERAAGLGTGPVEETTTEAEKRYMVRMAESGEYPYLSRLIAEARTPHQDADAQFDAMLDWVIEGILARVRAYVDL
ncbi:TetR/AcrR family transcriptional regulator [Sciscionella marina]|uniref:TetR/AcrR family transcriptional regulator n=1 Tax=Sciscionella marina TaxID=508770 RepID=UPI000372FD36|nr:TetR/AcrR family transcriptional regulator [Sciscionella marina]